MKWRWFVFGALFSILTFVLIYFFIYSKIMIGLGGENRVALFFSDINNVIIFSLIIGFSLGSLTSIEPKKRNI
jgi:hypothetical protein